MEIQAIRIRAVMALLATLSSCGIPTTSFLGAPDPDSVFWSILTVSFSHNVTDNSTENFLGYEIYYKFYEKTTSPSEGDFGIDVAAFAGATPTSGRDAVVNQGFHRVSERGDDDSTPPLISISGAESATDFQVVLFFPDRPSASAPESAVGAFLGREVLLVRDPLAGLVLTERHFESDDISTDPADPDVPPGISPEDTDIHMAIVILAYGIDFTGGGFDPLYSDPLIVEQPLEIILQ